MVSLSNTAYITLMKSEHTIHTLRQLKQEFIVILKVSGS